MSVRITLWGRGHSYGALPSKIESAFITGILLGGISMEIANISQELSAAV
jgi:hypothetical protein